MSIHTTDAIVLRHYPYRETSALVTCLPDRFGKLKGLVKGLRDQTRPRYRSAMEPLTLNRIVFYDTRTSSLHLISQCDLLQHWPQIQTDLERAVAAASCVELVDALVEPEEPQPQMFRLLADTLQRLSEGAETGPVRIYFMLRLLRLSGFHPQLDECTTCRATPTGHAFWSAGQGGVICEQCLVEDPSAQPIGLEWLNLLSRCAEAESPLALEPVEQAWLMHRLQEFLHHRLDRPLKTLRLNASHFAADPLLVP